MGTWKLNEQVESQPGPREHTVVYEACGRSREGTVDGVDGDGNPTIASGPASFDGKFYPVTGDATADMRSYRKITTIRWR